MMTNEETKLEQARKIALDVYRETGDLKQASAHQMGVKSSLTINATFWRQI